MRDDRSRDRGLDSPAAPATRGAQKRLRIVLGFVLVALVRVTAFADDGVVLNVPDSVVRGDAFVAELSPGRNVISARIELINSAGEVVSAQPTFRVSTVKDVPAAVALLAVDSTDAVGSYRVRAVVDLAPAGAGAAAGATEPNGRDAAITAGSGVVVGAALGRQVTLETTIAVEDRPFVHEDIPLNTKLSDLREVPDPRQVAEAEKILAILNTFDPQAVYSDGQYSWPLDKFIISSHYGDRRRYLYSDGKTAGAIHTGVDMAAPEGTAVHAAADGKVVFAGPLIISGNTVVLEHLPGVYGLYYHMSRLEVQTGDLVTAGQEIGNVGMTGLATGPHLHWEIRVDNIPVEPTEFLKSPLIDKGELFRRIVEAEKGGTPGPSE